MTLFHAWVAAAWGALLTVTAAQTDGGSGDVSDAGCPGCTNLPNRLAKSNGAPGHVCTYPFFPQAGVLWGDLFLSNFTDRVAGGGIGDYENGIATYDGHRGIDSNILTWDQQNAGYPVFAALDGTVSATNDGEDDMNTVWNNQPANYVTIHHGGTHYTRYYHLKKNSVAVAPGEQVYAGQQIGLTGSSGISTAPHLHFETIIDSGAIEPFTGPARGGSSMWQFQPEYATHTYIREFTILSTSLSGWSGPPEPTANNGTWVAGSGYQWIYIWWYLINRPENTTYTLEIKRPDGSVASSTSGTHTTASRRSWVWRSRNLIFDVAGTWHADLTVNGELLVHAPITVVSSAGEIANRPPLDTGFQFRKHPLTADDVPVVEVAPFNVIDDPDYDLVHYRYVWKVNGVTERDVTTGAKSDALARNLIQRGDTLRCEITPTDMTDDAATYVVETVITETFSAWADRLSMSSDPADNPDADGLPNLLEYVTGKSPTVSDSSLTASFEVDGDDLASWDPGLPAAPVWADVRVDFSTDLSRWDEAEKEEDGPLWYAPENAPRGFFKLTATPRDEPALTVDSAELGSPTP